MDMFFSVLLETLQFSTVLYIAFGVFLGLVVGAIPGLSAPIAIALAVPLTYQMDMITAIGFLVGINKGGFFGGSISAILLNAPGTAESALTACEGYPMAKKGKGLKAIKYALASSCFGDGLSTLVLFLAAAPLASLALHMGPSEICAIITFALALIALLDAGSFAKGLIATSLGMLLGTVGMDPASGMPRLTMDMYQLERGIPITVLGIGFLALPSLILQSQPKNRFSEDSEGAVHLDVNKDANTLGIREFFSHIKNLLRSSSIGIAIGALPGIGATFASFVAYGVAKNNATQSDSFGKGNPDGIVATESANNAVIGASLIPLFTLGIPGNVATALLIGAFIMHGVSPGPLMFENHTSTIYGIYSTMILSNIFLFVLGLFSLKLFIRVLSFPRAIILPTTMTMCLLGVYMAEQSFFMVQVMLGFAIFGLFFRLLEFSLVPFIIGFILSPMFELSFQQAYISFSPDPLLLIERPVTILIFICTLIFSVYQLSKKN